MTVAMMIFLALAALCCVPISIYGANPYAMLFAIVFASLAYLASRHVFA